MKNKISKFIAMFLAMVIIIAIVVPINVFAESADNLSNDAKITNDAEAVVKGTNSVGELLADAINEQSSDIEENDTNYVVNDVVVNGNIASVTYYAETDCIVVVAVYDEKSGEMLASGNADVSAEEDKVDITINTDSMPKYFALKAFMIDSENNPLSHNYATGIYTESIQFVKNMEVSDFDSDKVLNLDNDETTNFAVYSNGIIDIPYTDGYNIPQDTLPTDGVYVFTNCNDTLKSLTVGDSITYKYGNDVMLIKVDKIEIKGDTVILTQSDDVEMESFFDYIKIETEATAADIDYDSDGADESVTFEGYINESDKTVKGLYPSGEPIDINTGAGTSVKFNIAKKDGEAGIASASVSADLSIALKVTIKFYYNASWNPVKAVKELKNAELEFGSEITLTLNGKMSAKGLFSIPLGKFAVSTSVPGVYVDFTPNFNISASSTLDFSVTVNKYNGFKFSLSGGLCNTSKEGKVTPKVKVEGEFSVGVDFGPKLIVLDDDVMDVGVKLEVAAKINATPNSPDNTSYDSRHSCKECFGGQVKLAETFGIFVKFLDSEKLSVSTDFSMTIPICSYYYSMDHDSFDLGDCPYKSYRVTFVVLDGDKLIGNEELFVKEQSGSDYQSIGTTNPSGRLITYLEPGTYSLKVKGTEFSFTIMDEPQVLEFDLSDVSSDSDSSDDSSDDSNDDTDSDNGGGIIVDSGDCSANMGEIVKWVLYENGLLYIHGAGEMENYLYENRHQFAAPWIDSASEIKTIIVDDGVENVGAFAFQGCSNVTSVTLGNSVKSIGRESFEGCSSLIDIEIPNSVTSIEASAFCGCASLKSITIPDSVTSGIQNFTFGYCTNLTSVNIGNSVEFVGVNAFTKGGNLKEINVDKNNENLSSIDGVLFNKEGTKLLLYPNGRIGEYVIPNIVTQIGEAAFAESNDRLTSVIIPNSVTLIGMDAFCGCKGLINVNIPSSVINIRNSAFWMCTGLTSVTMSDNLKTIGRSAFQGCSSLKSVTIGKGVEQVGSYAFCECINITDVYFTGSSDEWYNISYACLVSGGNDCLTEATMHYNCSNSASSSARPTATLTNVFYGLTKEENAKTVTQYRGLISNNQYIVVVVRSEDVDRLVAADNLVYIDQFTADENGKIRFNCTAINDESLITLIFGAGADNASVDTPDIPVRDSDTDTTTDSDTESDVDTATDSNTESDVDTATDSDPESDVDTETDSNTESDVDTATDSDTESDVDTTTDSDTESDVDTSTNSDTESDVDTETDSDTESDVDTSTDSDTESDVDTTTDSDTESDVDTSTDSDTESDVDTATDSDPESDIDTTTDSDTESDVDTTTDSDTESDVDTATDSDSESDVDTDTSTDTDTTTDSDTDSDTESDSDTDTDTDTDDEEILIGDINEDGRITVIDSLLTQRIMLKLVPLDDKYLIIGDADGDRRLTITDCIEIQRVAVGYSTETNIGKWVKVK